MEKPKFGLMNIGIKNPKKYAIDFPPSISNVAEGKLNLVYNWIPAGVSVPPHIGRLSTIRFDSNPKQGLDHGLASFCTLIPGGAQTHRKRFLMWPPTEKNLERFYRKGADNSLLALSKDLEEGIKHELTCERSELLYIPHGWIHYTHSFTDGFCVGYTFLVLDCLGTFGDIQARERTFTDNLFFNYWKQGLM